MNQAVRENRQGKVRVAGYMIQGDFPEVALLRSRMTVCEVIHDDHTRTVWFIGYAPEFEPLELGQRPPEYDAIFTWHVTDPERRLAGLAFRRAGQNRRIEEFKAAGDEWLRRILGSMLSS